MHVMATIANRKRISVRAKIQRILRGFRPRRSPDSTAARKQLVPTAVSQLKSNFAFSGVVFVTTGCARETALCRYGTSHPPLANAGVVALPIAFLMVGSPHSKTKRDRIANGIHAFATCAPVWRRAASFRASF